MKEEVQRSGSRLVMILLSVLLLASLVYAIGTSLQAEQQTASLTQGTDGALLSLPVETDVNLYSNRPLSYLEAATDPNVSIAASQPLEQRQERRAFAGAPPVIPHEIADEQTVGENSCLQCHAQGGYVPQLNAYSPVVPHPEFVSCLQCHVAVNTTEPFRASDWQSTLKPTVQPPVLLGSPPLIPHGLQMRENCLACHAGPAVAEEIRVSHPERVHCQQCHLVPEAAGTWQR